MKNAYKSILELIGAGRYLSALTAVLPGENALYAGTVGLDGRPQVRHFSFAFEKGGALYFLMLKSERMYAELSKTPYLQICRYDAQADVLTRLSGKAVFTEDSAVLEEASAFVPHVKARASGGMKMLIAFFLTGVQAEIITATDEYKFVIEDPSGLLTGITIKKKKELKERISTILERRETELRIEDAGRARMYDGALFVFAEAAKAVWPRLDVRPVERSAVFETYDEREKYTAAAASCIGNAVISFPEDLSYWLDPGRWTESGFSG